MLRKDKNSVTFHVQSKANSAEYALRVVKCLQKLYDIKFYLINSVVTVILTSSPFQDKTLHQLQDIKKHPNIVCYTSLWTERAPSDWIHRKNWSLLVPYFCSHQQPHMHAPSTQATQMYYPVQAEEPPIVLMTLTESLDKETLTDWLLRTKQTRPEDTVIDFFEQVQQLLLQDEKLSTFFIADAGCFMLPTWRHSNSSWKP